MELMVVITIIAALAGLLIPGIGHFRKAQRKAAITAFAGAIQSGLVRYQQDYRDLPPSYAGNYNAATDGIAARPPLAFAPEWNGGEILAQAMLGPLRDTDKSNLPYGLDRPSQPIPFPATLIDDGMDGLGFRSPAGKKSGPYIELKNERNLRARWNRDGMGTEAEQDELWETGFRAQRTNAYALTMYYGAVGAPFLYFRANPQGGASDDFNDNIRAVWGRDTAGGGSLGTRRNRFTAEDNGDLVGTGRDAVALWKHAKYYQSGTREYEDRRAFAMELRAADYLLVHPGPDSEFGVYDAMDLSKYDAAMDDIFITGTRTH
jgi:type II secretory pathway pseudopilin PulG